MLLMTAIVLWSPLSGLLGLPIPRGLGFRLIMLYLLLGTLVWWSVAAARGGNGWRGLAGAFAGLMLLPALQMLVVGRGVSFHTLPIGLASLFQLWHMGMAVAVPAGVLVWGIAQLVRRVISRRSRGAAPGQPQAAATPEASPSGLSRREWLIRTGLAAPAVMAVGGSLSGVYGAGRFAVHRRTLAAPWLPQRLRGLTITHLSDLHVGRLFRPEHLPRLVDEANALRSDLVVLSGDLIDFSNQMIPPLLERLAQLEHRHGLFICLGNHDLIDNGAEYISALRKAGHSLLIDNYQPVTIGGERLSFAGLDWGRSDTGHQAHVDRLLSTYAPERDGPLVALVHHPHAFDALADRGVPLVLSGHTHGGQLMAVAPPDDGIARPASDVGLGRLLFRYLRGFYTRGDSTLFVNSGVGNWFPLRVNAPAEIVQLQLV